MPRAAIPERLRARQLTQQVAAAQRDAASADAVIVERVEVVETGLPANLQDTLNTFDARLDNLENPPP